MGVLSLVCNMEIGTVLKFERIGLEVKVTLC